MRFDLDFRPAAEAPRADDWDQAFLVYNQCDGYHIMYPIWWDEERTDFWGFRSWASTDVVLPYEFYCAWARLPDSITSGLNGHFRRA